MSSQEETCVYCEDKVCQCACIDQFADTFDMDLGLVELTYVQYRYEVHSKIQPETPVVLSDELSNIESNILEHLSNVTQLDGCGLTPDEDQVDFFADTADSGDWLFPDISMGDEIIVSIASSLMDSVNIHQCK